MGFTEIASISLPNRGGAECRDGGKVARTKADLEEAKNVIHPFFRSYLHHGRSNLLLQTKYSRWKGGNRVSYHGIRRAVCLSFASLLFSHQLPSDS